MAVGSEPNQLRYSEVSRNFALLREIEHMANWEYKLSYTIMTRMII